MSCHHSCDCKHDKLKLCKHCNVVFCLDCKEEWPKWRERNYWTYPYTYTLPYGGSTSTTITNPFPNTTTAIANTACSHP